MKFLLTVFLTVLCIPSLIAAPGGGHHKITEYDYHDFMNQNIESKTFIRNQLGTVYDFVWSYDRSIPGEVLRTEIATIPGGSDIVRKSISKFLPTADSFGLVQTEWFDTDVSPPALAETKIYSPTVAILTNTMVPGIAWASSGEVNSTSSGMSYFIDKREVVSVENVDVTAGTFNNCLKIHSMYHYGPSSFNGHIDWICPDVGMVKRIANGRVLLDLVSVTYNE